MRQNIIVLGVLWLVMAMTSCQKYNNIDNGGTVKVPYTLYIGGFYGTMHKTNDGLYYNTLFHTDNSIVRQVLVADSVVCNLNGIFITAVMMADFSK